MVEENFMVASTMSCALLDLLTYIIHVIGFIGFIVMGSHL